MSETIAYGLEERELLHVQGYPWLNHKIQNTFYVDYVALVGILEEKHIVVVYDAPFK